MLLIEPQINFYYLYTNDNKINTSFKSEELIQQNSALRQTIDVLERENNLLKSLIFINSLTSNNNLSNHFLANQLLIESNFEQITQKAKNISSYKQSNLINTLLFKIKTLKEEVYFFKKEYIELQSQSSETISEIEKSITKLILSSSLNRKSIIDDNKQLNINSNTNK